VVLAVLATVVTMVLVGRVVWVATVPPPDHAMAQLRYLDDALNQGAAGSMQGLFPEGEFFLWTLTGVAAARVANNPAYAPDERSFGRDLAHRALQAIDDPAVSSRFGEVPALEHGIFYRGWRLTLINEIAHWDEQEHTRATKEAQKILAAVDASTTGWVDSYPGQAWPCDGVVGLAAAAMADPVGSQPIIERWMGRIVGAIDPATGLLAHSVDQKGYAREPIRGSSQSIIATFWPHLSADPTYWETYTNTLITTRLGMVGALEHTDGNTWADVDSGPLIFGLSPSASAVTQAAARAHGDLELAQTLNREIEFLGFPWQYAGKRSYFFGTVPVATAFFVWADTTPVGTPMSSTAPHPSWVTVIAILCLPTAVMWVVVLIFRRRSNPQPFDL
jgi:hypothetical protein